MTAKPLLSRRLHAMLAQGVAAIAVLSLLTGHWSAKWSSLASIGLLSTLCGRYMARRDTMDPLASDVLAVLSFARAGAAGSIAIRCSADGSVESAEWMRDGQVVAKLLPGGDLEM